MKQTVKYQKKNRITGGGKVITRRVLSTMLALIMMLSFIPAKGTLLVHAAGYNAQAAINYARQYANGRNPQYADYGNNDCSNFVSQCLTAGGLPQDSVWNPNAGTDPRTGYNNWRTTALKDYLINKGYQVIWNPSANQILPGNPVFYSTRSDYATSHTGTNHAAICVSNNGGNNPLICAHSNNRLDYPHSYMMSYYKGCCTILLNGTLNGAGSSSTPSVSNPGAPYPIPSGNVRYGNSGDSVKWIQACVNEVLGAGIAVDGQFGNDTIYAVKVFQQRNGLSADGIVGSATTNKMLEVWRNKKAEAAKPKDTVNPVISNIKVTDVSEEGYRVTCNISDNVGVTTVKFPTWTVKNGQDDLIWHVGTISGNTATFYVKRTDHKNEYGTYITHIYAYDAAGNQTASDAGNIKLSGLNNKKDIGTGFYAVIKNKAGGTVLTNTGEEVKDSSNARMIKSNSETGDDNQLWYFEKQNDGSYKIISKLDERCLDIWRANDATTNPVYAYQDNASAAQRWNLYEASGNCYYMQGKDCENTLLEIYCGSTAQGGTVHLYEVNKSNAQQFYIQKYYQATFKNGGSVVKSQMVKAGSNATAPDLSKDGYTLSWDGSCSNINSNKTINAIWTKVQQESKPEEEIQADETDVSQESTEENITTGTNTSTKGDVISDKDTTHEEIFSPVSNGKPEVDILSKDSTVIGDGNDSALEVEDEIWEDLDEEEPEIGRAGIKSLKNKKKQSLQFFIKKLKGVDGYEVSVGACNQKTLKKLKRKLANADGDTISMSGMKKRCVKKTGVKISNLKKNKTYYVLVRGYKKIDGEKVYGEYSSLKCIKIKK